VRGVTVKETNWGEKMELEKFQAARLIPTTGIKGDLDQERRTTSAFLAVLVAVPEFAKSLTKQLGAPSGKISTYIEPEFALGEKRIRPDGLIVVERGSNKWTALVEVKTSKNSLQADQINNYLELCRLNGVDALWTISNEVLTLSGEHPTQGVDLRKTKKTKLAHFSWIRILTEALLQKEYRGISDPDQAWILGELIRYLQHPASGALEFSDMGDTWVGVRQGILAGTLSVRDKGIAPVVNNFESLMRFVAFRLSAKLGVEAKEIAPKLAKSDPGKHLQVTVGDFVSTGQLIGSIGIPKTVSPLVIRADLKSGQIFFSVEIPAPAEGRSSTRVSWLLRQLKGSQVDVRIETKVKRSSTPSNIALLSKAIENPALLTPTDDKEISAFIISTISKMGTKRGEGSGSFIESVVTGAEIAYSVLLERIKTWTPKPVRLQIDSEPIGDSPFDPTERDTPLPE
jgi:hypothetical protein